MNREHSNAAVAYGRHPTYPARRVHPDCADGGTPRRHVYSRLRGPTTPLVGTASSQPRDSPLFPFPEVSLPGFRLPHRLFVRSSLYATRCQRTPVPFHGRSRGADWNSGASGAIRTPDLPLTKGMLLPLKLRRRNYLTEGFTSRLVTHVAVAMIGGSDSFWISQSEVSRRTLAPTGHVPRLKAHYGLAKNNQSSMVVHSSRSNFKMRHRPKMSGHELEPAEGVEPTAFGLQNRCSGL